VSVRETVLRSCPLSLFGPMSSRLPVFGQTAPLGLCFDGLDQASLSFLIDSQALKKSDVQPLWFRIR
jgi:hypothetical protein